MFEFIGTYGTSNVVVNLPTAPKSPTNLETVQRVTRIVDASLPTTAIATAVPTAELWQFKQAMQSPLVLAFGRVDNAKTLYVKAWNTRETAQQVTPSSSVPEVTASPALLAAYDTQLIPVTFTESARLSVAGAIEVATTTKFSATVGRLFVGKSAVQGVTVKYFTQRSESLTGIVAKKSMRDTPLQLLDVTLYGPRSTVVEFVRNAGKKPILIAETSNSTTGDPTAVLESGSHFATESVGTEEMGIGYIDNGAIVWKKEPMLPWSRFCPIIAVAIDTIGQVVYVGNNVELNLQCRRL